jgi:Peptidase inhibitor family I36
MFTKLLLATGSAVVAMSGFASIANAQPCLGLDCPGVTPPSSASHGLVSAVEEPQDLESNYASGFYDFGSKGPEKTRAVAYVVAPGDWDSTPAEIKALPAAVSVPAAERARNTIVIYGAKVLVSVPPTATTTTASAAQVHARQANRKKKSLRAGAAAFSDCPSGWFCLFDDLNGTGARGQWSSTGYWQNLSTYGWQARGSSMNNRRNAWTLLERYDGAHYCAIPNSQDGSLSNNGYNNNTTRVYLSVSTTKQSGWACTN